MVHSSVFDCHGLAGALSPFTMLQKKLKMKKAWAVNITSAQTIKVRVWVQWSEGTRRRTVFFDTTRFNNSAP